VATSLLLLRCPHFGSTEVARAHPLAVPKPRFPPTPSAHTGLDYSKWDSVELSDDDSDCHPNIEKDFWLRIKKEKREKEKEDNTKEVLGLRADVARARTELEAVSAQLATAEEPARAALAAKAKALTDAFTVSEAKAEKIVESERKRNWNVQDKFDYSAVNVKGLEITTKKAAAAAAAAAAKPIGAAGSGGVASGGGAASSGGGEGEVMHEPAAAAGGAPAAADGEAMAAEGEGEEENEEETALNEYVEDMEAKAQELGCVGNMEDCFDKSWEIIKQYPEVAVKETTDYLLLVGNDLAKKGEEDLGRAFVHQSLMMQYCMDLSVNGANGVAQFFKRMNHPEPEVRRKARGHFEAELDEYWGKILARARSIAKENAAKGKQQEMLDALKPPGS